MVDETAKLSNIATSEAPAAPAPQPQAGETPSERIIRSAVRTANCTDTLGRTYTVRRLMPSDKMRLMDALGPERSKNEVILGNAMIVSSISEMSGQKEGVPTSWAQLLALMDRVGDEGIEAVAGCMQRDFGIGANVGDSAAIKN